MVSNDPYQYKAGRIGSIDKSAAISIEIPDTPGGMRLNPDHVDSTPPRKTIVYLTGKADGVDLIVTERCVIARSDRAQRILDEHKNNADVHKPDGGNEVINADDDAEIITDGGRDTRRVSTTDHVPLGARGRSSVEITFDNNQELTVVQKGSGNIECRVNERGDEILTFPETVARGPEAIEDIINSITPEIPDDVERTARQLLHIQSWVESQDTESTGDYRVDTQRYRPLREQRLVLVTETEGFRSHKHHPVVVAFNDDVSDKTVRERCDKTVESRILDGVCCMTESYYQNPEIYYDNVEAYPDRIRATDVIEIDSLAEADAIAFDGDDDSETGNDNSVEETQKRQQSEFSDFGNGGEQ